MKKKILKGDDDFLERFDRFCQQFNIRVQVIPLNCGFDGIPVRKKLGDLLIKQKRGFKTGHAYEAAQGLQQNPNQLSDHAADYFKVARKTKRVPRWADKTITDEDGC